MGIITSLIKANHDKKYQDVEKELDGYKAIIAMSQHPDTKDAVKPETLRYAIAEFCGAIAIPVACVESGNSSGGNCAVMSIQWAPSGWFASTWTFASSVVNSRNGVGRSVLFDWVESA